MASDADELIQIARSYQRFATVEARGSSPSYERLAHAVADSPFTLAFLKSLPAERRQPNLFFAALREVVGVLDSADALRNAVQVHGVTVRRLMCSRTTQTNEPARCAVLLPILASLAGPLAILEVGASAGLCLLPDQYAYRYANHEVLPGGTQRSIYPVFTCAASASTPMPKALPVIVWRRGLDLNPLSVRSVRDMAWLEMLVWPEHQQRADNLKAAIQVAQLNPPVVRRGDLRTDVAALIGFAPKDAQLVVFHSAVLAYVAPQADRDGFARLVRQSGAIWISNEPSSTYPEFARLAPPAPGPDHFLLCVDATPVAWTHPHGRSIDWFAP